MATFTMNSQNNFVKAPAAKNIFDKAFAFSIALVVIVAGIWGIERLLIFSLNRQIADYKETTASSMASLQTEDVQSVHDITSRITFIEANLEARGSVEEIFTTLERSTIPQVKLTKYEYKNGGAMALSGVTSDYRFLAEQLLRYRQEPSLATAQVLTTDRNEDGQIIFDIQVVPTQDGSAMQVSEVSLVPSA